VRQLNNINFLQSLRAEKLVFDEDWGDALDRTVQYLLWSVLIFFAISFVWHEDLTQVNNAIVAYGIVPLVVTVATYVCYRKATEYRFALLPTKLPAAGSAALVLEFARQQKLEVFRSSRNLIVLNEPTHGVNSTYRKTMVFLLTDGTIRFTVVRDMPKLSFPVLTSHLFLKRDLRRLLAAMK